MKKKFISFAILLISDLAVILISFIVAHLLRSEILPALFERFKTPFFPLSSLLDHFYMSMVWIFIFASMKLYTKRYPFFEEVKFLIKGSTLSFCLIMISIFITRQQLLFSRTVVVLAWIISLLLFPLFRYTTKIILGKLNFWKKKLFILGVQQPSLSILRSIHKNKTMGYEVLGFLDNDHQKMGKSYLGVPVIGPLSDLEKVTQKYKSKDIMIATPHLPRKELKKLLIKCEGLCESMWLIPRAGDFISEGVEIEVLGDVLTLYIKKNLAKPWNILIKTIFDMLLTSILMILLMPVFVFVAAAIKLDSKGPIIFLQKRLGKDKREFNVFKYRSMYVDSDSKLIDYLNNNLQAREEWGKFKKLKNHDPRVTRVGRIIRRYSLDELPQLFNVIQGRMSLVGPRPYLPEELIGKDSFKEIIARVKPGITGLWQISGRSELPFEKRIDLDEFYIRNWSLWLDFSIFIKSIKVMFSRKGAY